MLTELLIVALLVVAAAALRGALRHRKLAAAFAELQASARTEALTGLRNSHAFIEDLELELRRADRSGRAASLMVLRMEPPPAEEQDPDTEMQRLANAVRGAVRSVDQGYRIGKLELALILPETRARGALEAAKRIEDSLAPGGITGSVAAGIAELGPGIDRQELFAHAYSALLAAGRAGRSRVLAYSPELAPRREDSTLSSLGDIARRR